MGGRAGGGGGAGFGSRSAASAPKLSVVKETEKAVQVEAEASVEYVPDFGLGGGGYTSSMIKYKTYNMKVWLPKSQIKDGKPSDWIKGKKEADLVDDSWLNSKMFNGRVNSVSLKFKYK